MKSKPASNSLVPFRLERSGHITVTATLGGEEARFIVDTGAGGTCLDSGALEGRGLKLSKRTQKGGGVGDASHAAQHREQA